MNLQFINSPRAGKKVYLVEYGPITPECRGLPHKIEGHLSNTNMMSLELHVNFNEVICFHVMVSDGTKTVNVSGKYDPCKLIIKYLQNSSRIFLILDYNIDQDKYIHTTITIGYIFFMLLIISVVLESLAILVILFVYYQVVIYRKHVERSGISYM